MASDGGPPPSPTRHDGPGAGLSPGFEPMTARLHTAEPPKSARTRGGEPLHSTDDLMDIRDVLEDGEEGIAPGGQRPRFTRKRQQLYTAHCGDCGVVEGQYHVPGCDLERCPFCSGQLISCECIYERLGLFEPDKYGPETANLPPEIYEGGPSTDHLRRWEQILGPNRYPYIDYPLVCARCGRLWPEMFMVPDAEWQRYIEPAMRRSLLCRTCYDAIKSLTDAATKT